MMVRSCILGRRSILGRRCRLLGYWRVGIASRQGADRTALVAIADVYAGNVLGRNDLCGISGCEKAASDELVCLADAVSSAPCP